MGIVCTGTTCYKFDPEGGLVLNHYVYKTPTIDDHNGGAIVNWKGTPLFVGGRGTLGPGFEFYVKWTMSFSVNLLAPCKVPNIFGGQKHTHSLLISLVINLILASNL